MPLTSRRHRTLGPLRLLLLFLLLGGFLTTTLFSYYTSLKAVRSSILSTELPLTSDNVYSEIQRDLVRPVLIASMMASDTFLHDWIKHGEQDVGQITRYLREVQNRHNAFTSFFVSEKTRTYFQSRGILKQVAQDEPRDAWYFRVRELKEPYEINVDIDMANQDSMAIFINYRVLDEAQHFLGVTGVGLSVESVVKLIDTYQKRFDRTVYLVNPKGVISLTGEAGGPFGNRAGKAIADIDGLDGLLAQMPKLQDGSYEYEFEDNRYFVNVRYIPELKHYLFVTKHDGGQTAEIRQSLWLSVLMCLLVTAVVMTLFSLIIRRYQLRIERLAATDQLTELPNRRGFEMLAGQALEEARREQQPLSAIVIDLDHFKTLNDTHGHLAGDVVLKGFANQLRASLRRSDIVCRWGGEEFIVLFKNTPLDTARQLAEKLRVQLEQQHFFWEDKALKVTISIGLTNLTGGEGLDALIARADRALYRAKQSGRNQIASEPGASA